MRVMRVFTEKPVDSVSRLEAHDPHPAPMVPAPLGYHARVMTADPAVSSVAPALRRARIGSVSYLNARPLVEGLEHCRDVELTFDVPARLLGALLEERADVALAPVMDVLTSPEPLSILPVGCIASNGPVRSVMLFSRTPIGEIRSVRTDPESRTSAALAAVLLTRVFNADATLTRGGQAADADAVLRIGDKVERDPPDQREFPHRLDLGAAWTEWTGMPFVYAAWVCVKSREQDATVTRAADVLDRQRRRNALRIGWIAARRAAEHGWRADAARSYLTSNIRYDLTPAHLAAVERFTAEARSLGLC